MRKIIIPFILLAACCGLSAQNTTYSPCSMFGIGDLSTGDGGLYAGMGGVGIGLRSSNFINAANPSALTEIGVQKYVIDVGLMAAYKTYTQSGIKNNNAVGNINNFGFGFRILPKWYTAFTLAPISSVGYAITLEQQIEGGGSATASSLFEGEGGISKIGVTNAYQVTPNLSLGMNLSFVTGSITQKEKQGSATIEQVSDKRALYFDFGAQYKHTIDSERSVSLGLVYGPHQFISQDNTLTVSSTSGGEMLENSPQSVKQYLPQFLGMGVSYRSLRWTAGIDYKFIDWSRMEKSTQVSFDNQHRLSAGMGYVLGNPYKNYKQLQAGTGLSNSYVVINGKKANSFYLSTGVGFNFRDSHILSVGAKYSNQFNASQGMQREKSISFFLNIAFSERTYKPKLK